MCIRDRSGTSNVGEKNYEAIHSDASASTKSVFTINAGHELANGESIRIIANNGDLPENIDPHRVYYAITGTTATPAGVDSQLASNEIRIASSLSNAQNGIYISSVADVNEEFNIISRVSDKKPGDAGHPIQYDGTQWFIHTDSISSSDNQTGIFGNIGSLTDLDISYIHRREDNRSLDEKVYKLRYVVPKELTNGKDPSDGFILQDSSSTNVSSDTDFNKSEITSSNFDFDRNTRFISYASFVSGPPAKIVIRTDKPHNLNVGDQVIIRNVKCDLNSTGLDDKAYNGTFIVTDRDNSKEFRVSNVDVEGAAHSPGTVSYTHLRAHET